MTQKSQKIVSEFIICRYFDNGYCKYHEKGCFYNHPEESCSKQACSRKGCHKRHPKPCRYNQYCRRGSNCLYKHTKEHVSSDKSKNDCKIKALEEKMDQMKSKAEEQIKLLEYKVNSLMEEKYDIIKHYDAKLQDLGIKLEVKAKEITDKDDQFSVGKSDLIKKENDLQTVLKMRLDKGGQILTNLQCTNCDVKNKKKTTLKNHKKIDHDNVESKITNSSDSKIDNLNTYVLEALDKVESLEKDKADLQKKLKLYSLTIKKMRQDKKE